MTSHFSGLDRDGRPPDEFGFSMFVEGDTFSLQYSDIVCWETGTASGL